jgi:hypothetical protein
MAKKIPQRKTQNSQQRGQEINARTLIERSKPANSSIWTLAYLRLLSISYNMIHVLIASVIIGTGSYAKDQEKNHP